MEATDTITDDPEAATEEARVEESSDDAAIRTVEEDMGSFKPGLHAEGT